MMLGYSLLLTLALVLSAPWWLVRMFTTARYREGLGQRLGSVPAALRSIAAGKRVIWIHAVSVGEVLAASRLVTELEAALGEDSCVVISTTTRTGQTLARERFGTGPLGAAHVFYMPLDFAFATRAYLNALKPAALILMESELWPRMLHECAKRNIPVAVVNARVSDRSFKRGMKVRSVWKHILRKPTLWLAQSKEDARRIQTLIDQPQKPVILSGTQSAQPKELPQSQSATNAHTVSTSTPRVLTTGNLKYDIRAPKESYIAELIREAAAGRKIVVGGSTIDSDPPEDSWLIRAFDFSPSGVESPLLVLAPRHPETFGIIYSMAIEYPTLLATEMLKGKRAAAKIIVLDTIGDLSAVYGIADVAFIGGSLIQRGGHNPLEPAQFGVPVVMGPSFENFRDIVTKMKEVDGICIVKDGYELRDTLSALLSDAEKAKAIGERGRAVYESQRGATKRTVDAIVSMIGAGR
jgi:3-deoxy-D-manno-octulosonic-acid transferase